MFTSVRSILTCYIYSEIFWLQVTKIQIELAKENKFKKKEESLFMSFGKNGGRSGVFLNYYK